MSTASVDWLMAPQESWHGGFGLRSWHIVIYANQTHSADTTHPLRVHDHLVAQPRGGAQGGGDARGHALQRQRDDGAAAPQHVAPRRVRIAQRRVQEHVRQPCSADATAPGSALPLAVQSGPSGPLAVCIVQPACGCCSRCRRHVVTDEILQHDSQLTLGPVVQDKLEYLSARCGRAWRPHL